MHSPRPPRRDAQSGLSTLEVMIMASLMSVLMIMVTESLTTLTGVRADQRAHFKLGDVADQVARRIEQDVNYATRLFTDNAADIEYLQAMGLGFDPLAAGRRLPKLTAQGYFEADKVGNVETGNVLFVARRLPRVEIETDPSATYHAQSLVFVVCMPIDQGGRLDLLRWTSSPVIDYWDVMDITDPSARAEVLAELHQNGVHYAWDSTSPRASGLFEITPAGGLQPLATDKTVAGTEEARPFLARRIQIAANGETGTIQVPLYARALAAFPGGVEIKVDGAASGKLVLFRLVTQSTAERAQQIGNELLRFFTTRG